MSRYAGAPETRSTSKTPKASTTPTSGLDAPLEAINGSASGVSRNRDFRLPPTRPRPKGKIVVASSSLELPNKMQVTHMKSDKWLDVAQISGDFLEVIAVKNVQTEGNNITADDDGNIHSQRNLEGNHGSREVYVPQGQTQRPPPGQERRPPW